jgi:hypothetical protein
LGFAVATAGVAEPVPEFVGVVEELDVLEPPPPHAAKQMNVRTAFI